ncbi:MAG: 4Fe-4S dicluster domain-containing protein [Candidatus Altiarchaeales archaeon]|nr:4Fe-4S dicluster domain-containing protein [Candidatus Altiarchaeota archaeon]MBU4267197.1 4Fe-4S dicluster domain-containing protein [Candidatus Altiarchaeota archaeon]MBU4341770.1 4Fe-4S dicluster domain-containing protein [Candidatus Altiarchaeota archaeon]MBU4437652.1 4Fe-4S dicluster domain-containing protein [Candidatus Altiarchaeota archaeon]MCG2782882.1 4Fe-4S dicluster domain-containing protein [Candidatus Altiarchaeales archaeon]
MEKKKSKFRKLIEEESEKIMGKCLQCGECGSVCPIGYVREEHSPRKTMLRLLQDDEGILDSDQLWLCTTCHSCSEMCPKGVDPDELFIAARNYARESGHQCPGRIKSLASTIVKDGLVLPIIGRAARWREELKLEEIKKPRPEDLKKLSKIKTE